MHHISLSFSHSQQSSPSRSIKTPTQPRKKALREKQTLRAAICRRGQSSIYVPNLKRMSLFVQKLLGERVKNFEIRSRGPRPFRVVLYSVRMWGRSSISVPNLKRIAQLVETLLKGHEIRSRDPGHAELRVVLWSLRREAPSSVCTKFEADSSFRSKVIRVPNFAAPQTPSRARDGQNLISWRWSLPLPTNPVW